MKQFYQISYILHEDFDIYIKYTHTKTYQFTIAFFVLKIIDAT